MGEATAIEWCHHSFNPWWGCTKIAAPGGEGSACDHCYAAAFSHRLGKDLWGKDADRRFFGDAHWNEPLRWNAKAAAAGERHRVFCASMADVFEPRDDLDPHRARLWRLIDATPNLDWLLLTKRPEHVRRLVPTDWLADVAWPTNAWMGATVEDERNARIRIPRLLAVPGVPVRFLSCEPLLGEVDLWPWLERLDWIILGGESGPGARPMDPRWARRVRDDCQAAAVPLVFKQWGDHGEDGRKVGKKAAGRTLDGVIHDGYPEPRACAR